MADNNTVILRVQLDSAQTEAQLKKLILDLEATRKSQAALAAERKAGTVSDADFAQRTVQLSTQLKGQQTEFSALQKTLTAYQLATGNAAGSVDSLKGQSALLTTQYNKLSEAERTGTEAGKVLGEELKKVNDTLKNAGANVGDFRRNVGNYSDALKGATVSTKDLKGGLTTISNTALKPFQGELDRSTGFLGKFKAGNDLVNKGLAGLKGAGETGSQGFKAVAAGVALTGLGVFLLLLQAVVTYFTSTAEGGKLLKQALAGVGAVVNTLTGAVFGLGKGLVEAAKNPKQAFEALLGFLKDQVINRFRAFGVILDGINKRDFKQVANGILQLETGIANSIDKATAYAKGIAQAAGNAVDLTAKLQALGKQRKENEVDEVKEKGRVEELLRLSKDRTLSAADRLNKLREAGRIETELSAKSLDITKQELDLIQQRNKARGLNRTADEVQEERDKRREYNQTVAERNSTLAGIKARQSRFILEEAAELKAAQKKLADAAAQRAKDVVLQQQAVNNKLLAEVERESAAELALKKRGVDLAADLELAGEKKTQAQVAEVRAVALRAKSDLDEAYRTKEIERAKRATAAQVTEQKREYAETQKNLEDYLDTRKAQLERDLKDKKISQATYQSQLNALEAAGYQAALVNAEDYGQGKGEILKKQADFEKKLDEEALARKKKLEDTKKQIRDAAFEAAANTTDLVIELLGKESAAGQAALITQKTLSLANIAIKTEEILIANAKTAAEISSSIPPPVGPILGVAYKITADTLAISQAAAAAAKILGFQRGGLLDGPSHAQGGIPFAVAGRPGFEAEGGEAIINKRSTALFLPMLDLINQAGGGRALTANMPTFPRAALGAIAKPLVMQQLRGDVQPVDWERIGKGFADSLRRYPPEMRWSHFETAKEKADFTKRETSF